MSLFKAFFYKEWIKLRMVWWILFAANLLMGLYILIRLNYVFRTGDATSLWGSWIFNGSIFFGRYNYIPVLSAVVIALVQFIPEVQQKRIRLFLHLPVNEERAVAIHLAIGLILLGTVMLPAMICFVIGSVWYFPPEALATSASVVAPWLLAGVAAYLIVAGAVLEQTWRYRLVYVLLFLASIRLFYQDSFYGAYNPMLIPLLAWVVFLVSLPMLACYRFRKGLGA